jgi:hypothetical protein
MGLHTEGCRESLGGVYLVAMLYGALAKAGYGFRPITCIIIGLPASFLMEIENAQM